MKNLKINKTKTISNQPISNNHTVSICYNQQILTRTKLMKIWIKLRNKVNNGWKDIVVRDNFRVLILQEEMMNYIQLRIFMVQGKMVKFR